MRYLYYCNSAYQLLGVLNLHWHRKHGYENIPDYSADLILVSAFDGAKDLADIVSKQNTFDKVYSLDKAKRVNENPLKTVYKAFSPSYLLYKDYEIGKEVKGRYDYLSIPKYTPLMEAIWKLNPKAKIHLFEDGMAAYFMSTYLYPESKKHHMLNRLFGYDVDFRNYEAIYLDSPEIASGYPENKVRGIPKYDDSYLKEISRSFEKYAGNDSSDKNIYWFAQFLNNQETIRKIKETVDMVREYAPQTLFCRHPRYLNDDNAKGFDVSPDNQIWEMKVLGIEDISNTLLISIHSTACFTPKILYNKEPYLILFYRMLDPVVTAADKNFEDVVEKFRKTYSDPEKVMLPETMDELKACIEKFRNRQ